MRAGVANHHHETISTPYKFFAQQFFYPVDPGLPTINNTMQNSSEQKGRKFGKALAEFFIAAPRYIIVFFLPFIVLNVIIVIFDMLDPQSLGSAIVISTIIASLAYYYKK